MFFQKLFRLRGTGGERQGISVPAMGLAGTDDQDRRATFRERFARGKSGRGLPHSTWLIFLPGTTSRLKVATSRGPG